MSIGRLRRKLDIDLINKMASGWVPTGRTLSNKSGGRMIPRGAETYRASRRNALKRKR